MNGDKERSTRCHAAGNTGEHREHGEWLQPKFASFAWHCPMLSCEAADSDSGFQDSELIASACCALVASKRHSSTCTHTIH
jgi:hypothetical protein